LLLSLLFLLSKSREKAKLSPATSVRKKGLAAIDILEGKIRYGIGSII
jgi:hypothetical protein